MTRRGYVQRQNRQKPMVWTTIKPFSQVSTTRLVHRLVLSGLDHSVAENVLEEVPVEFCELRGLDMQCHMLSDTQPLAST